MKTNNHCGHSIPARVHGHGFQARAALVDGLKDAGEGETAYQVGKCASWLLGASMTVNQVEGGGRFLGGLNHCGRNLCPICAPYLSMKRQEGLGPVVDRLSKYQGLRFYYCVMTLRHHLGARWRDLYDALRFCQRGAIHSRKWKETVLGFIRALETTHGQNGHHPHENMILALPAEVDPEPFFAWLEAKFQASARRKGRTADWAPGWWSEVKREELGQVVGYLGADDKMGGASSAIRETLGAPTKHQPVWAMPSHAFAEVWRDSKGVRWFGVGGCFKTEETDKTDEELNEEREDLGAVVAHVPKDTWKTWTPQERRDRQAILTDPALPWAEVVPALLAWGGVLGPQGDPWEGAPGG